MRKTKKTDSVAFLKIKYVYIHSFDDDDNNGG